MSPSRTRDGPIEAGGAGDVGARGWGLRREHATAPLKRETGAPHCARRRMSPSRTRDGPIEAWRIGVGDMAREHCLRREHATAPLKPEHFHDARRGLYPSPSRTRDGPIEAGRFPSKLLSPAMSV